MEGSSLLQVLTELLGVELLPFNLRLVWIGLDWGCRTNT